MDTHAMTYIFINVCSQIYLNITGDSCLDDGAYIFVSNGTKIERSNLNRSTLSWETLIETSSQLQPLSFDVDITTCTFFYSTGTKNPTEHIGEIHAVNLTSGSNLAIHSGLGYPMQVAVNWVTQKLYWSDNTRSTIEYSDCDGENNQTLVNSITEIQSIALNPCTNDIYWVSKENGNYAISKMKLDGTEKQVILPGSSSQGPNSLVIDFVHSKLYWTNGSEIQTSDLNGEVRSTVYRNSSVTRLTAISIYGNKLYWAKWRYKKIGMCTINGTCTNVSTLVTDVTQARAIHAMDRSRELRCSK